MTDATQKLQAQLHLRENVALYALFVLSVACVLVLCAAPRPLVPSELPALRLSEDAFAAVLAQDALDEKAAPKSAAALELERLFLEYGEAEDRGTDGVAKRTARGHALVIACTELIRQGGTQAFVRLRARELGKLEAALSLRLPEEQIKGVMGTFANALARHGVTQGGEEVAPHIVLRSLYKARFNLAVGQPSDASLADVERIAFHGWLALRSEGLSPKDRLHELDKYAMASGASASAEVAEAEGVLLYQAGAYAEAERALVRARAETGSVRLRNYALGARLAAVSEAPTGFPDQPTP